MDSKDIQQLLRPGAFPHPAYNATLRETHISWVILCGEFAYKIKKPVEFGFLIFRPWPGASIFASRSWLLTVASPRSSIRRW